MTVPLLEPVPVPDTNGDAALAALIARYVVDVAVTRYGVGQHHKAGWPTVENETETA